MSPLVLLFQSPQIPVPIFFVTEPCAPITISITVTFCFKFFQFSSKVLVFKWLFTFLQSYSETERQNTLFSRFLFFCRHSQGLVVWPRWGDLFVSQNSQDGFWVVLTPFDRVVKYYHYYYHTPQEVFNQKLFQIS